MCVEACRDILNYLNKNFNTDNFEEIYFKESIKILENTPNCISPLIYALKNDRDFKLNSEHWHKLVEHSNLLHTNADNVLGGLARMYSNCAPKYEFSIPGSLSVYIINEVIQPRNENSLHLERNLLYIKNLRYINPKKKAMELFWPDIKEKDWLIEYFEKSQLKKFSSFLEMSEIITYKEASDQKKKIEKSINYHIKNKEKITKV